jgi:hypothetical protein
MTIFKKLLSATLIAGAIITGSFFISPEKLQALTSFPDLQSFYRSTLTSTVSSSGTTINVSTAPNVTTGLFVIEPRTTNQEIVYMTGRTGTALTVVRGLGTYGSSLTASTTNRAHAAGVGIEMADVHYYIKLLQDVILGSTSTPAMIIDKATTTSATSTNLSTTNLTATNAIITSANIGNVTATTTFNSGALTSTAYRCTSASNGNQLCDKDYIDSVGSAGASNANTTTKGIVEEATVPEINSGASTGGTGAKLFMTPASFSVSNFASSSFIYSYIPKPLFPLSNTDSIVINALGGSANTVVEMALFNIPQKITISRFTFKVSSVNVAGKYNIGIYSEDGQTRYLATTTVSYSGTGMKVATTSSPVTLLPGNYWIAIQSNGTANLEFFGWGRDTDADEFLYDSQRTFYSGTTTATASTLPTSFATSSINNIIASPQNKALLFRLD